MAELASCSIREVRPDDWGLLETIYQTQESITLPVGYYENFCSAIRCPTTLYLVAESGGRLIGGGGVSYYKSCEQATLCFGLVDKDHQRRGFGTSMLLARLALLNPDSNGCDVAIQATKWTAPFFQRIGFGWLLDETDELGQMFWHGHLRLFPAHVQQMRHIIAMAGVELSETRDMPTTLQ